MAYFLSSLCRDFLYNLGKNAYLSWAFTHLLNGNYGALHYCEGYAVFLKFLSFLEKLSELTEVIIVKIIEVYIQKNIQGLYFDQELSNTNKNFQNYRVRQFQSV